MKGKPKLLLAYEQLHQQSAELRADNRSLLEENARLGRRIVEQGITIGQLKEQIASRVEIVELQPSALRVA